MSRETKYYLNGQEVDKKDLNGLAGLMLVNETTLIEKYYIAPVKKEQQIKTK